MFNDERVPLGKKRMTKRQRMTSNNYQLRSCGICTSVDGIEVYDYCSKGDIIACQVCSANYVIESKRPLRLTITEAQKVDYASWVYDE